jgi:uncharacterized protein YhdP
MRRCSRGRRRIAVSITVGARAVHPTPQVDSMSGGLHHLRRVGNAFAIVLLVAWLIFATIVIVLRYAVLPNVGLYRGALEQMASKASGETVRIGAIDASWRGLRPSLALRDITVVDAAGGEVLTLPSVRTTLSWETLFLLRLRLASLEVDAPRLTIRRDAEGQLFIAGFPIRKKASPDNQAGEWLLAQDEIRLRGATIVWHDEMNEADDPHAGPRQDLVMTDVAFALVRSGWRHRVSLRASPPATLAAPLDIRAVIDHPLFASHFADPAEWSGEVYANLGTGDIVAWKEWLPLPKTIDAGHGRARVWMTFSKADAPSGSFAHRLAERIKRPIPAALDRIGGVTADLALDDVAVRWGAMADAPEYSAIGTIDGRLVGSQSMTEQRMAAIHMALQPKVGAKVAPTDFEMRRTIGATLDDESGTASLGAIDIGVSLGLVPGPLIPPALADRLAALKPLGALEKVAVKWTGPIAAPQTFEGNAKFSRLALAPQAPTPEAIAAAARETVGPNGLVRRPRPAFGQPGFENLAGTLTATRALGKTAGELPVTHAMLALQGDDVVVIAPGLFDEPTLRLAHLAADVGIRVEGPDVEVKLAHAALDNADLAGTVDMTFRHGPKSGGIGSTGDSGGGRGWIDLDAKLSRAEVGRVPRYLPNIIGERARIYLKRSLISGKVSEASLRMRGPLEHLNLREMPDALATPNPVSVPNALIAIRDGVAKGNAALPAARGVGAPAAATDVAKVDAPNDAIFHALIKVHDATYLYGPGRRPEDPPPLSGVPPSPTAFIPWPAFEDVDADIVFDLARMTVHARSARVYGYKLTDITAELPALADPKHVLRVVGKGTGSLQDLIKFVNNSPISRWLRRFTDTTQATGNAGLALALDLPLTHPRDTELSASLQFAGNDLALNAISPPLLGINGRMDFSDRGLTIDGLTATALGGPLRVDAATHSDGYIVLDANGTIDVAALQKSSHEGEADGITTPFSNAIDRAAKFLSGSTQYTLALRVRSKRVTDLADSNAPAKDLAPTETSQPDLVVQSNLVGLAIALPAPLAKPADASWPLRVELARTISAGSTTPDIEDTHITLADKADVNIARRRNAEGQLTVTRAGYRVGVGKSTVDGPSDVTIELPSIDVDAWRDALKQSAPPRGASPQPAANASYDNLLPGRATLKTASLRASGRDFTNVAITAERTTAGWQADVNADQVAGKLSYTDVSGKTETRAGVAPISSGKLVARLTHLSIPQSETTATHVDSALDASKQKDFPAIDAIVDRFDLRGRSLGRLEVVAENVDAGTGREWRLEKLGLTTPEARFAATGVWGREGTDEHTHLDFNLDASDVGALLDRFGSTRTINNGTAKLSGNASWNGGPSTIDFGSMSGSLKLEADKGQFLKAEPGIAKLLNILSLQGLARRLTLDFTDVFSPGFAFDTVRADAVVDHGIVTTNDFTMRGVQAIVKMSGSADLEHETTKLHVRVEPQINAGAASLGVAVINPIAGLATFAAQYFFKDQISQALSFEYNVSGPWSKPDVTKIDSKGNATPVVPRNQPAKPTATPREATNANQPVQ